MITDCLGAAAIDCVTDDDTLVLEDLGTSNHEAGSGGSG